MSEFTEKLNSSELVSKAWDEIDRDQANAGLLIDTISNEFKDWQPPKPLVVVPQIMADFIEEWKEEFKLYGAFFEIAEAYGPGTELYDLVFQKSNGQDLFARAWIDGYTVEKEKLYLLKHIEISNRDTTINCYLTHTFTAPFIGHTNFSKGYDMSKIKDCHFTQSEIDDMETGSYEQIAVTVNEV
ncbi:DUF1642 domain-containing protein [Lactococcus piscium]|uniref:DUF1642 domain-containing protein n=1 Tax=Pseudolactococcus paracarnosus TaxID=2749962 RepID=UPI001FB87DE5|nr:DUF1642 domain-containing protein [Lactococcus paracarnosus]MCJ1993788.1 DUF1642 domain-containing protein [Lactococcus paracarnosus]